MDEEIEMKTSGDMEGYELSVTASDTAYLWVPHPTAARERRSAKTLSVAPYEVDGYEGPDIILDLDDQGRLLGIEILY